MYKGSGGGGVADRWEDDGAFVMLAAELSLHNFSLAVVIDGLRNHLPRAIPVRPPQPSLTKLHPIVASSNALYL